MAQITSYATLKTAIQDYLARADLDSFADNFIQGAEECIYSDLRAPAMETALDETIASGVITVPSDFIAWKAVYVDSTPIVQLEPAPLHALYNSYPTRSATSKPFVIARNGANFEFGPYPDSAYDIKGTYYARLTGLGSGNTTNFLTSDHPTMLLYACLAEAARFNKNQADEDRFERMYQRHLGDAQRRYKEETYGKSIGMTRG